jgi:hypothetical protein
MLLPKASEASDKDRTKAALNVFRGLRLLLLLAYRISTSSRLSYHERTYLGQLSILRVLRRLAYLEPEEAYELPDSVSGVAVLSVLKAIEYRTQDPFAGSLVLLEALGLESELGHPTCEAGAAFGAQDSPGEDALNLFEGYFLGVVAVEQVFEGSVECFSGCERETQGYRGLVVPQ